MTYGIEGGAEFTELVPLASEAVTGPDDNATACLDSGMEMIPAPDCADIDTELTRPADAADKRIFLFGQEVEPSTDESDPLKDAWRSEVIASFLKLSDGYSNDELMQMSPDMAVLRQPAAVRELARSLREIRGATDPAEQVPDEYPIDFSTDPFVLESADALSTALREVQANWQDFVDQYA